MAALLQMEPDKESAAYNVPEHRYVRWGTAASITAHLLVALIVFILAYLNHIKNLRDLMSPSHPVPPPPQTEIEVIFPPDEIPPPPTDHPLFINQIVKIPPPPIIPPKIKPKPIPKPTPHPPTHLKIVSHAETHAAAPAALVVGTGDLPHPNYPAEAQQRRIQGTVEVRVSFDISGSVSNVEIISSSGSSILDDYTRHYILQNWRDADLAGKSGEVPVVYNLQ